jgi:hypothetical protein
MFDASSIAWALTSTKAIVDLIKNANDAQLAIRINSEIASLQGTLLEVQQQALSLNGAQGESK